MTAVSNFPSAPVGQQGPPARAAASDSGGTPRRARVPPIDYRDGLSLCLTNIQETDITTIIQRRRQHPAPHWSRSIGTAGRDPSEWLVAIVGIAQSRRR